MDVPPEKPSHGRFRNRRYGVYDIAYEDAASPPIPLIYALRDALCAICEKLPPVRRLLTDTLIIAPVAFVTYLVTALWRGMYSAINLYWLSVLFDRLEASLVHGVVSPEGFRSLAISWILCVTINVPVGHIHSRSLDVLNERFRAFFIPQLIRASMRFDVLSVQDMRNFLPMQGRFASEFPGGRFLIELDRLVEKTLDLTCQVFVILHVISCRPSPEREILLCLCIARGLLLWLAPQNGISTSTYVYWPHDRHFQRMKTLFGLAFSTQYRADLVLDGQASSIETEYNKAAERLRNVDTLEPTPWCIELSRDWYWDFLMCITSENILAIYVLIFSAYLSPSSISSIVLLQQAIKSVSSSIVHYGEGFPSIPDVCSHAVRLYAAIDYKGTILNGTEPYPRPIDSACGAGMKISFRNVSLRYPKSAQDAVHCVSFDVLPGNLVLVVGANGSGKSTILKLLAGLFEPSVGEVWVDDMPRRRYDREGFRKAVAFQAQVPAVYPGSVRENITCGISTHDERDKLVAEIEQDEWQARVEAAARTGRCTEWIARLVDGYESQLSPSFDIDNMWLEGMYGFPSEALQAELARHRGQQVSLSGGEKQRLATARTFMRLTDATRLLLVDEATSALDAVAERSVLSAVSQARVGKTVVLVAHRFHHLVHAADRILCMKEGSVVECGTHAELVRLRGEYAALYHAQVDPADAQT